MFIYSKLKKTFFGGFFVFFIILNDVNLLDLW